MRKNDFTGTSTLVKLALRRDRIKLPVWILGIVLLVAVIAGAYKEFSLSEMRDIIVMASASPGMRLLVAPISIESIGELGTFFLFRTSFLIAVITGLMSIKIILRHTRQNEETGCAELLASTVTGRYASLTAALIVAFTANIVLAVLVALALIGNGLSTAGSFAAGASFGAFGIVFASIAAVTAQLSESSRGSSGLASIALAFTFMINALGNVMGKVNAGGMGFQSSWLVWLSPLGWIQQVHAYHRNNLWILVLCGGLFVLMTYLAFILVNRRDVGRGILAARRGPAEASESLLSPLGLAWRLQRGTLIGWLVPMAVFSVVFGAASQEFGDTIEGMEMFQQVLEASVASFRYMLIAVSSMIISIYTIQALLRKKSEETGGTLEPVLATAVKRIQWMASHILCSVLGTTLLLLVFSLGIALSSGAGGSEAGNLIKFSLYQGAAIVSIAGFATAVYGLFPRSARPLCWIAVLISILAGPFFGVMINLPETLRNLSPFTHIGLALSDITTGSIITLLTTGIGMGSIGIVSFNRRSLSL
jgi:ABC-2 type transport system permease protein